MLLEKLELSSGFLNLEKKTNKPHTSRTSLLPSKEIINLILSAKEGDAEEVINFIKDKNNRVIQKIEQQKLSDNSETFSHNIPHTMSVNPMDKNFYSRNQEFVNEVTEAQTENVEANNEHLADDFDRLQQDLVEVFEMYCSLGDPMNTHYLSYSKFEKIIHTVNQNIQDNEDLFVTDEDIELIFMKASNYEEHGPKKEGYVSFSQFVFALELVSMKVYGYSTDGLTKFISDHIVPLKDKINQEVTNTTENILKLMDILKNDNMVELLEVVHQSLHPYYSFYANEAGLMSTQSFIQFCRDFKIFPDVYPEQLVMHFYKTLSNFQTSDDDHNNIHNLGQGEMIDENLFIEILALSALEMKFQESQTNQSTQNSNALNSFSRR